MMKNLLNPNWWDAAITRAVKTMCQAALAIIGTGVVAVGDVNWRYLASVSVMAGLISLLTSVVGLPEVDVTETLDEKDDTEAD